MPLRCRIRREHAYRFLDEAMAETAGVALAKTGDPEDALPDPLAAALGNHLARRRTGTKPVQG